MGRNPGVRKRRRHYGRGPRLFKRGEFWWCYHPDLDPTRRSLQTKDDLVAQREFAKLLERGGPGELDTRPAEASLSEIAQGYLAFAHGWTRRSKFTVEHRVLAFVKAMEKRGVKFPSQITADIANDWRTDRQTEVGQRTINRDETCARRMLAWAAHRDRQFCADTPLARIEKLREPKRTERRVIPSPATVASLVEELHTLEETGAALTVVAQHASGFRIDELRHIQPENVLADGVEIKPEKGPAVGKDGLAKFTVKGFRERFIPLSPRSLDAVRAFVEWRVNGVTKQGQAPGLSNTWLAAKIDLARESIKKRTGVAVMKFRSHSLRYGFATEAFRAGVKLTIISGWLGHVNVATTEGYIGVYAEDSIVRPPESAAAVAVYKTVYQNGVNQGLLLHTRSGVVAEKSPVILASPGRVELPTNGLGNHDLGAKSQEISSGFVHACTEFGVSLTSAREQHRAESEQIDMETALLEGLRPSTRGEA